MKNSAVFIVSALMLPLLLTGCGKEKKPEVPIAPVQAGAEVSAEKALIPAGIWQTASMTCDEEGNVFPEHTVQFTGEEILYGHMEDGQFVPDYSDRIAHLEEAPGGVKVQAEASNGVQYTYQTAESDSAVLEFYETWKEEDFPEKYRGGASLSRAG